jgi:hypothetical protein
MKHLYEVHLPGNWQTMFEFPSPRIIVETATPEDTLAEARAIAAGWKLEVKREHGRLIVRRPDRANWWE